MSATYCRWLSIEVATPLERLLNFTADVCCICTSTPWCLSDRVSWERPRLHWHCSFLWLDICDIQRQSSILMSRVTQLQSDFFLTIHLSLLISPLPPHSTNSTSWRCLMSWYRTVTESWTTKTSYLASPDRPKQTVSSSTNTLVALWWSARTLDLRIPLWSHRQ